MAASPIVDPKGLSCSDRTPPATPSPVSATRPAFPRPSLPILLFGSPLRKLQPSQLAIEAAKNAEAAKPKRAANDAAPKTLNLLSLPPIPHWLLEGLPTPPGAPSPSPLAPSPVALIMEDSPPTLPLSSCSYGSHNGAPTMDTPPTPETGAAAESPLPRHAGGDSTSFKKAMDSVYVQAATFQVRPEFGGHVHLGSTMRAFMGQWTRHPEALKGKFPQRHPEPQITGRTEGQV